MDPHIKAQLNKLKCPLCKSQIDIYDQKKGTIYNFCCVSDYTHYRTWFPHWDWSPIHYDMVHIYEGKYLYTIDQRYLIKRTSIDIYEIDAEGRVKDASKKKSFTYEGQIFFDYPNTNREKIIKRLKTILTFQ